MYKKYKLINTLCFSLALFASSCGFYEGISTSKIKTSSIRSPYLNLNQSTDIEVPSVCLATPELRVQVERLMASIKVTQSPRAMRIDSEDVGRTVRNIKRHMYFISSNVSSILNIKDVGKKCAETFLNTKNENPGSLDDVYFSMLEMFYVHKMHKIDHPGKITTDELENKMSHPTNWAYLTDYFTLANSWLKYSSKHMYKSEGDDIGFHSDLMDDFNSRIYSPLMSDILSRSCEWKITSGDISGIKLCKKLGYNTLSSDSNLSLKTDFFGFQDALMGINAKILKMAMESDLSKDNAFSWEYFSKNGLKKEINSLSPALFMIIGNSLRPVIDRVGALTRLYDIECKFKSCTEEHYLENRSYKLINFFAKSEKVKITNLVYDELLNTGFENLLAVLDLNKEIFKRSENLIAMIMMGGKEFVVHAHEKLTSIGTAKNSIGLQRHLRAFIGLYTQSNRLLVNYMNTAKKAMLVTLMVVDYKIFKLVLQRPQLGPKSMLQENIITN